MEAVGERIVKTGRVAGLGFYLSDELVGKSALDWHAFCTYRNKLLTGGIVNKSENRAAWHSEFCNPQACAPVKNSLAQIKLFSEKVRHQQLSFEVKDVVNIGIGGSDLGPKLICEAFEDEVNGPNIHFVSNLDSVQINFLLRKLSPQNTLFIVTSKSFNTLETTENLLRSRQWLLDHEQNPAEHIVAVTANRKKAVKQFQVPENQIFDMPEWVGGRYSLWSAVGLSVAVAFGFERFYELHEGAHELDRHFYAADCEQNMPLQYALQLNKQIQNNNVKTLGILPYSYRLRSLAPYLQQLFMESLGKSVDQEGLPVYCNTGPVVYGGVGTNTQHSFQQLMMQGTHQIFADFILPISQCAADERSSQLMLSNCVTQVQTLKRGVGGDALKMIPGGHCANMFVLKKFNFSSVGALIAFYEHAVASLAFLMNVNAFDQWGVGYAKTKVSTQINFDSMLIA